MGRRVFSEEFKSDAAKLVREQGYSVKKAAHSLGVYPSSLRDWLRKFAPAAATSTPGGSSEQLQREIIRLREENRRLLMEREILKKAAVFFAKEQP